MRPDHFVSKCTEKHFFGINERAFKLISHLRMRQTPRRQRNQRGEFIAMTEDQVETAANQVVANVGEQRQVAAPARNSTKFGALVALRNWQIAITPDRTQLCLWSFIMITNFLSMLSMISFWICTTICVRTLPVWDGPARIFEGYMHRQSLHHAGNQVAEGDNIWTDIFPPAESREAYSLKIALTETASEGARVIFTQAVPLLFRHPLVWAGLTALSFLSRGFLSFIHGCLERAYRATSRQRSS